MAGLDFRRGARLVEARAQVGAVDRGRRLLQRARVVDAISVAELRIREVQHAAVRVGWAVVAEPGVLDAIGERRGAGPGRDAHDLDRGDPVACVRREVALAETQRGDALGREGGDARLGAAGPLHAAADGAHLESRRLPLHDGASHRRVPVGAIAQVEPEQDARSARGVDLAALQSVPDAAPVATRRVRGDESAGVEEAR